jgi:hypothetical protein
MISIDFFGCEKGKIDSCNWDDAFERFPSTGLSIPDQSALTSLNEALTGNAIYPVKRLPQAVEPIYELDADLVAAIRRSDTESLKDGGVRWAQLKPWNEFEVNPMDLAGFLLELRTLVDSQGKAPSSIFLWLDPNDPRSL